MKEYDFDIMGTCRVPDNISGEQLTAVITNFLNKLLSDGSFVMVKVKPGDAEFPKHLLKILQGLDVSPESLDGRTTLKDGVRTLNSIIYSREHPYKEN